MLAIAWVLVTSTLGNAQANAVRDPQIFSPLLTGLQASLEAPRCGRRHCVYALWSFDFGFADSVVRIVNDMQVLALSCILAGFGLGVYLWTKVAPIDRTLCAHVSIGIITTAFALLQSLALVARPKPNTKLRWDAAHVATLLSFVVAAARGSIGQLQSSRATTVHVFEFTAQLCPAWQTIRDLVIKCLVSRACFEPHDVAVPVYPLL